MRRRTPPVVSPFVPRIRYTVSYSTSLGVYLFVHFVLAVAITVSALNLEVMAIITSAQAVVIALLAFGTLGVHGSVLDGRAWARTLEKQRVVVLTACALPHLVCRCLFRNVAVLTCRRVRVYVCPALLQRPLRCFTTVRLT